LIAAIASVGALLLSAALLLMGNGLQTTLLPVRADLEAFATVQIGVMGSAYFVGFVVGCVRAPHYVRWVGHIRAFTAMVAIASAVPILHLLVLHPIAWWILRAMTGFCLAGLYLVIESWLNERSTNETRGTVLSVYTIIQLTVITLGQLMITLADPSDFALFGIASIIVSIAAVPVALTTQARPPPPSPRPASDRSGCSKAPPSAWSAASPSGSPMAASGPCRRPSSSAPGWTSPRSPSS
jgi:MFS family permease